MTHYATKPPHTRFNSGFIINVITMVDFDSSFQQKRTKFAACSPPMTHFKSKHTLRAVFYFLFELVYTRSSDHDARGHNWRCMPQRCYRHCRYVFTACASDQLQASSAQVRHPDVCLRCTPSSAYRTTTHNYTENSTCATSRAIAART